MVLDQLSILLHEIVKEKMSVEPWEPIIKRIDQSRLAELDLDNLQFQVFQKTAADCRLMELFPGPIVLLDHEGVVVFANSSALAWVGKSYNEVNGEFIGDLFSDRRRLKYKGQFLSPTIEVWAKKKECFLEKCYVTTALLSSPVPVEITTKNIIDNDEIYSAVVIFNRFSAGNFDTEIMCMYTELLADSPELLLYFSQYISGLDVYTRGHCKNVAEYAGVLGMEIGLTNKEMEELYIASMLHDIGNLAVSPKVLYKKGKLIPAEMLEIQIHPLAGSDILEEMSVFRELSPYVRHHHERYDGTGYPGKLKGTEIPLLSRIIAIADAFDAMTSYRPYRQKLTLRQVREELINNAGTQFDPNLVDIAIYLIDVGKLKPSKYCSISDVG
ncbi:HD domain-containing phosphohydrolase [Peptococcaceae bacterium 1198_IL3148]